MSDWYPNVRKENDFVLNAIKEHPFITQLMDGTLPKSVFHFYIHQDAIYLSEYKKILALVATKCEKSEDTQFFLDSATGIIHVENALHQTYIQEEHSTLQASPTCQLYTSYLYKMVYNNSLQEGLAAVLPCFTIYKEIGDYILANQTNKENNPYQDWINTYGGEDFGNAVKKAIEITHRHSLHASDTIINNMNTAFQKAAKLEWMFWDSAFNQEKWKI